MMVWCIRPKKVTHQGVGHLKYGRANDNFSVFHTAMFVVVF